MKDLKQKEIIVIIGFGWVGQANALALARMGYDVFYYDVTTPHLHYTKEYQELYDRIRPLTTPLEKDSLTTWYILSIGDRVSEDGVQDISLIERALGMLTSAQGKIILRSTILPHYLQNLRFHYYFPEFLHEIKAVEECLNPFYYVLGKREEMPIPSFLEKWEERAEKVFKGTPEEASHIKYLSNIWNAVRIGFVNEFGDSITEPVSTEKRKEIERILDFILERKSYLRYGQGFGGHCLPKDLRAYMRLKTDEKCTVPILKATYESNTIHEELAEKYQTLPQWFSFWDYQHGFETKAVFIRWWKKLNSKSVVQRVRHTMRPMRRMVEKFLPNKSIHQTKESWNIWATKNAYYYANPDTKSGRGVDEFEVRQTGQADVQTYILSDSVILQLLQDLKSKTVLEIGSGVGRMTEYLAPHFGSVYGVDISRAMIEVSKKRLATIPNIILLENSGNSLPFEPGKFDMIFSYLTFRHFSNHNLIESYLKEIVRVLKTGGITKIHLRTGPEVYRWHWFHGVSITREEARQMFEQCGLKVIKIEQENAKSLWVTATKP